MRKKFLTLFSGLAATFANTSAFSSVPVAPPAVSQISQAHQLQVDTPGGQFFITNTNGDELEFLLRRSEQIGILMAGHRSHRSHSSHRSHYSSR